MLSGFFVVRRMVMSDADIWWGISKRKDRAFGQTPDLYRCIRDFVG